MKELLDKPAKDFVHTFVGRIVLEIRQFPCKRSKRQEFLTRPDGYPAIEKTYNMKFKDVESFCFPNDLSLI